jgi:hypothetical protein
VRKKFVVPVKRSASRDPYAVASRLGDVVDAFRKNKRLWLWAPAFAGTTLKLFWRLANIEHAA